MPQVEKQAYSISEVAKMLGVSRSTIQEMIFQNKIPWMPVGERRKVIPKKAFEEWIEKNTQKAVG